MCPPHIEPVFTHRETNISTLTRSKFPLQPLYNRHMFIIVVLFPMMAHNQYSINRICSICTCVICGAVKKVEGLERTFCRFAGKSKIAKFVCCAHRQLDDNTIG